MPHDPNESVWLDVTEAARYCRMSDEYLRRCARHGLIRGEQITRHGRWRFHVDWLDEFLAGSDRKRPA